MPYVSNGSLTTDKRVVDDTTTWDAQSDWEAYQSAEDVVIDNGSVQLAQFAVQQGLARWPFDDSEDTTTALDEWGSRDLSLNGPGYVTDSALGSHALEFAESDVATLSEVGYSGPISFTAWVDNPSTATDRDYIMGATPGGTGNNNLWIGVDSDGEYFSRTEGSESITTTTGPVRGEGYVFVGTTISDAGDVTDYVDGSEVYAYSSSGPPDLSTVPFEVGNRGDTYSGRGFEGLIDDPRIYDRELTSQEMSDLASLGP